MESSEEDTDEEDVPPKPKTTHWSRRPIKELRKLDLARESNKRRGARVKYTSDGRRIYLLKRGQRRKDVDRIDEVAIDNDDARKLGNASFETPEMKAARAAMRNHPRVAAALNRWWDATDLDGNGAIDREEYIELGKALYRVMIADGNEAEAYKSAVADWEEDSNGGTEMDGECFKQAIFQCVGRSATARAACPPPPATS